MEKVEALVSIACLLRDTSHKTTSTEHESRNVTLGHRTERVEAHGNAGEGAQAIDARLGDLFFSDLRNGNGRKGKEAGDCEAEAKSPSKKDEKTTGVKGCDGQNQHGDEAEDSNSPGFDDAQSIAQLDPQRRGGSRGELAECESQGELVIGANAELLGEWEGSGEHLREGKRANEMKGSDIHFKGKGDADPGDGKCSER